MKTPIRYFSIGLLTATIVLFIMYVMIEDKEKIIENLTVDQLSEALEEHGYRTITQEDFISYSVYLDEQNSEEKDDKADKNNRNKNKKSEQDNNKKDKNNKKSKEEKTKDSIVSTTITVKEGYVSKDIAETLKDAKIINDEQEFINFMENNGYSSAVQIGKFKVNSEMSLEELAQTLTTYPGE